MIVTPVVGIIGRTDVLCPCLRPRFTYGRLPDIFREAMLQGFRFGCRGGRQNSLFRIEGQHPG